MSLRGTILKCAVIASFFAPGIPSKGLALDYPVKPLHIVLTATAGGTLDIAARIVGQRLSERLGQPVLIEGRPGAAGEVAFGYVAKSPADGHTLIEFSTTSATNRFLYEGLTVDFDRDIAPVAGLCRAPLVLLVNSALPVRSINEFIAYAKANPGKVNFASTGNGSPPHLAGELFKMLAGVDLTHVPYRGGAPAMTDLLGGHVQAFFSNLPAKDYIKAGSLRALAVTTTARAPAMPELPAIAEFLPEYEASVWIGIGVSKATPFEIIEKLNETFNLTLAEPAIVTGLAQSDCAAMVLSPIETGQLVAREAEKWGNIIRTAHIKAD